MEELIPIFMFASIAAVAIFRPLTKRLGDIIELHYRAKTEGAPQQTAVSGSDAQEIKQLIAGIDRRLDLFEQRLDFTESLLESQERQRRAIGE